jgi:REP element-mobilizing transposase RayT
VNFKTRALRKGRHSKIGHSYHVVLSTQNNQAAFIDFDIARKMVLALLESDNNNLTHTLAYVVMPDHIHWLFELKAESLSRNVQRVKSKLSRSINIKVWQKGFYDHAIRSDESLIRAARYIVANPLRAGLVDKIGDYPHWDSVWLE